MVLPVGSGTADTAVAEDNLQLQLTETGIGWLKLDDDLGASYESVDARRDAHFLPFEAVSTDGQA